MKMAIANSDLNRVILWNSRTLTSFVFTELASTMKYGEGVLYNLVFTEWHHWVSHNEVKGRGSYITLFSPSDVTWSVSNVRQTTSLQNRVTLLFAESFITFSLQLKLEISDTIFIIRWMLNTVMFFRYHVLIMIIINIKNISFLF